MDKKRVRASNWDEAEKRLLKQLVLVLERIEIIENKDATTNTNISKKAAWQEVLTCFNSLNNRSRDLKELITQWRNTKGKVKTRESEYKRAKLMTGPPPPSPPAEDLAIIQAIPNEFIVDSNPFDSDSLYTNIVNQPPKSDPLTPSGPSSNQVEVIEEIFEDKEPQEIKKNLMATPVAAPRLIHKKNITKGCKPQHKKNSSNKEEELFLIIKRAKEREIERAEEIHKKRLAILDLEYDYWKKKSNNLD